MELASDPLCEPSAPEANLHNEHLSLSDRLSPLETPLDSIVQEIESTERNSGLELKLDLYVPVPPIIEPITPVEETVEHCALPVATQEDTTQPEAVTEGTEEAANFEGIHCENQSSLLKSSADTVTEVECEHASNETSSSDCTPESCVPVEPPMKAPKNHGKVKSPNGSKVYNADRKNIPPKKDKFNPLKIDFSKVIPLTSSQLSLQCLECHIIFSDSKSKERHLKMSHPAEYQQCMLGDALFTCYVCDQHFSSSKELMTHQRTHTGNERFKCPFCSEAFYRSCELTRHKKQTHFSKHGYTCSECGKPFKTFTLLRYHQRVHTAEKPFVCIHKHCGRKFSASKSLQHHLEKHQKEDNLDDQTNASATTKKKRDKGKNERKFPCSQCAAVFKTSKAQLLHIKNKHSQESQNSTLMGPQLKPPGPALTQTANGQPQTLIMETVGPAPQQMDKLDPEQIKRLIEKLGNVQKVNQLVILPLQPQSFGSPHAQPLMQPLHVNFTESTIQPTQCQKSDTDSSKTEQINIPSSEEIGDLQQKEAVLSQEENFILSENSEAQITPVELTQTDVQTQMDEIHLELIPIQTETSVLLDPIPLEVEAPQNDSINEMVQIAEEHFPVTQDIAALETNIEPPLIPPMKTVKSHHVEEDSVPVDTVALEETVTNEEMPCPTQMLDSTELSVESESLVIIEQGDIGKLSQPQELQEIQAQKDQAESEKEPQSQPDSLNIGQNDTMLMEPQSQPASLNTVQNDTMSMEPQSQPDSLNIGQNDTTLMEPQSQPASLNTVQNDTMPMEPQSQPDSLNTVIDLQQSSVLTPDQTTASLQDCPFVQKKIPAKKKRSKKQLVDKVETKEASKLCDGQVASTKKVNTSSKVITKKREKPKKKKLLVKFGPTEKKKSSKPKVIKPSKTKQNQNQQMTDRNQVPELSQHNNKLDFNQKVQKDKKGKGIESSSEAVMKTTGQMTTSSDTVLVEPKATQQVKPQKRKMKNQNNLDKKSNSVQEAHQDEALVPVQKKKKQGKTSAEKCPKKPKVRKTQNDNLKKNSHKLPRHKVTKAKSRPDVSDLAHVEKQALLLLKGHKQPQLKVHKLDATELEKSPPSKCDNKALKKTKKAQSKSLNVAHQKKAKSGENNLLEYQGEPLSFEMPSVENSPGSGSTKPKTVRKRKAPTKIDQEIALSPPYSQLTLGCQDCGKTFSEVSALQQHMASWHSAGKAAFPDETINVAKKRVVRSGPKEKCIPSNVFEIQVATDWDMETEVGEIVGERLSFPALSPSPSLTLASGGVEGKEQEGDKDVEGIVSRLEQPPEQNFLEVCEMPSQDSTPALSKSIVPQELTENASENVSEQAQSNEVGSITETYCTELKDAAEDEIKEELPPEINLVMVGEKNVEENHNTQIDHVSGVSQELENEVTNSGSQLQESAKDDSVVSTQNVLTEPEIKQEEEEVLVRRVDEHKRVIGENSVTKGKKGVERSRGKKPTGRRTSMENRSKKNMEGNKDPQECQVLYHLCVLDTPEGRNKEKDKNGVDASETSQPSSSEEAPEEQVVFELDSVTTSVMDIVNSEDSAFEESRELVRDGSSPGIILEKFLTARERNMENPNAQSQIRARSTLDTSKVTSANTSADVKIEERSSNLAHHSLISSESGTMRGVQMVLVKAEEHLTTNEMFQAIQPVDHHRVACQEKTIYRNRDGSSSDSRVVPLQSYSKQCIFYPVKEEEREHLVEPPQVDQTFLNSGELAAVTPIGASSGIEECEEVRVGSVQMDVQHLYSTSEEGDANAEQQRTQGFLEFLSENSDTDDADNVHSEPEAETIVMSCYHGIQSRGTVHQNGREKCNPSGRVNVGASPTRHTEPERQLNWKPINYFNQYFSVDTWNEIAVCTRETSKLSNLVTEKEVAQYVGIHIAMGTLKFPSTKLYWEDCTRVPLISDAMSASRFCELTRKVKLASSGASAGMSSDQQSEERNRNHPGPSNDAHNNKEAHNCTNLKTDPLWKVTRLIKRVQDGCQALNRQGSYGVDQYPLPFQRHPTHSLLHTVVINGGGLVVDFNLSVDDSNREDVVEKMVSRGKDRNEGMVFLCKPELSTPSMLEHLLEAGVQSAGKVGGARGQIGDEFVSSDGKLKLFRCHHGFILSAVVKEKPRSTSLVSGFERAIKAANLNRDLRSLYRTPCTNSAVSAWPQSVLWDLIDLVLVNAWIQYKQDYSHTTDLLSLMAFRLEVAKALILSSGVDTQDSSPPCPPAPKLHGPETNTRPSQVLETPLPDEHTRYDGFGHWPEQLAEGEEARRCRFGGCERTSRVRCLKCCVFLCISRNHNCFLKFHSQGSS
ncbi:zinc finger protein 576, tandem duplicate 1 [Garra rufa]|uniref:zinc finger protein 576, tandem duplicate 1 n=1 Tax=Garra rufa TaxID=137080 RepID=UPI003CCE5794